MNLIIKGFGLKSWTRSTKYIANNLIIPPTQHAVKCHNDAQMSLNYHLVDPLGDDEKDEQQSDVLDGC
jgi:hypothetical protein